MLLEKNNITRTHIDDYLESEGIHPQQILEVNNMDLLIDFAAIGMGVCQCRTGVCDGLSGFRADLRASDLPPGCGAYCRVRVPEEP